MHGADGLRLFRGELTHRSGDILRDVHQHRAFAAALGDAESRTHGVGQVFDPAHREVVLGDGHRDALDVGLLKAVLAQDIDRMEQLGIYEVVPEDMALCEFVCTSKTPVQKILSDGIELMMKETN